MDEGRITVIDGILISCSLRTAGTPNGGPDKNCDFKTAYPIDSDVVYCQHHSWRKESEENGTVTYSRIEDPNEIKI